MNDSDHDDGTIPRMATHSTFFRKDEEQAPCVRGKNTCLVFANLETTSSNHLFSPTPRQSCAHISQLLLYGDALVERSRILPHCGPINRAEGKTHQYSKGSYPYFHFIAHNKPKKCQPILPHYTLAEPQSSPRLLFFPTAWWKNTHRTKILKIHAAQKTNAYHGQTSPSATPLTT